MVCNSRAASDTEIDAFKQVSRRQPWKYPHILLHEYVAESQPRGRQRKTWIDNMREDCSCLEMILIDATRSVVDIIIGRTLYATRPASARRSNHRRQGIKSS